VSDNSQIPPPRYRWPWFVLALFLLGIALVIIWVGLEARRLREYRSDVPAYSNSPASATTNSPGVH
jgi:hypothetical protein